MQTIPSHLFDQFIKTRRVSAKTASAVRAVLVDGGSPAEISRTTGVARSAIYRLVAAYHVGRPGDVLVTLSCPAHHAETLRELASNQVALWRQADADHLADIKRQASGASAVPPNK